LTIRDRLPLSTSVPFIALPGILLGITGNTLRILETLPTLANIPPHLANVLSGIGWSFYHASTLISLCYVLRGFIIGKLDALFKGWLPLLENHIASSSSTLVLVLFLECGSLAVSTSQVGLSVRQLLDIRLISLVS
jgi:hypothetical protein